MYERKKQYMSIFNTFKEEITWGGKPLSIETGKIARQADGSVIVRYGDTMVHATVCAAKTKPETFEDFDVTVLYKI
jgi:polyribonucleotide nucleotidyltransferase